MNKKINVPSDEQETSMNRGRNESLWTIFTNDSTEKTKLKRAGVVWNVEDEDNEGGITVKVPAKMISYRSIASVKPKKERKQRDPNKPKRIMTDEQKAAMKAGRERKKLENAA